MLTPQLNPDGYESSAIKNTSALAGNVRFLIMHGVADDNVHMQNSLTLLDELDVAGVENYDLHMFPDSDHGIYFHNANTIVYDSESSAVPASNYRLRQHTNRSVPCDCRTRELARQRLQRRVAQGQQRQAYREAHSSAAGKRAGERIKDDRRSATPLNIHLVLTLHGVFWSATARLQARLVLLFV
jgi:hypothetical protein